jgi:hypothetical protein
MSEKRVFHLASRRSETMKRRRAMYRNLSRLRGIQSWPFLKLPQPGKVAVHFQRRVRNKWNQNNRDMKVFREFI